MSKSSGSGIAPLRDTYGQLLQVVLFWAGAILLPLGLVVIVLGWYGAANTPYQYDQLSYLVSGGLLGLGLTFTGGFLYFGAWLARIAADERESSKRLADTLLLLADVTSRAAATDDRGVDLGAVPVTAGEGTTMHRRDCSLIAHRDDLRPVGESNGHLTTCRVCRPADVR
ncbi:hypothetical protein F0U44_19025 [Nocardioides humilatus]|uniref:Uncharacterized protein n=1 Tax=Nocardioides humilatus TaxID=2607660 RepID=A0A5B1L9H6_9ACTN|nr:hypothetical protein [Nocardioides humilatus]KAA1416409.1 hypothetical protein F0U44_19025 [Nocardioides humilatus]